MKNKTKNVGPVVRFLDDHGQLHFVPVLFITGTRWSIEADGCYVQFMTSNGGMTCCFVPGSNGFLLNAFAQRVLNCREILN